MSEPLSKDAKLLLLISLLAKDRVISYNGKAFLKELVLRRDPRMPPLLVEFETNAKDKSFVELLHNLIVSESGSLHKELFVDTSVDVGKSLSKEERERNGLASEKSLIYGEVEFSSFYTVLRKINAEPGLKFYDLGSGTGKALFAARFTQDFSECVGIEILKNLHNQAFKIYNRYCSEFDDYLYKMDDDKSGQAEGKVKVVHGSFLDYDWSDGDVVFANSTCFDDDLMYMMSKQAERLKPGAIIVTFTKGLSIMKKFELLERKRQIMSWGLATVIIHRRLNDDGTSVGNYKLNILPQDSSNIDDEVDKEKSDDDIFDRPSNYSGQSNALISPERNRPALDIPDGKDFKDFAGMTSPQDSALLMRKRNHQMKFKSRADNL